MRGLAALVVCVFHAALIFPPAAFAQQVLVGVMPGSACVLLFFVHSGFVLAFGLQQISPANVAIFYARRLFRLWPMIAFSCLLTAGYLTAGGSGPYPLSVSPWFRLMYGSDQTSMDLGQNLWLSQDGLNFFFWSLQVEAISSLLMPFFVLMCRYVLPSLLLILAALFIAAAIPVWGALLMPLMQLEWFGAFAAGVCLAYLAPEMRRVLALIGAGPATLIAILVLPMTRLLPITTAVAVETLAAIVIVFAVYYRLTPGVTVLESRPLLFLGLISYSFYVNSAISIHLAGRLVGASVGQAGDFAILLGVMVALAINFALSTTTYHLIERPGMAFARKLAARGGLKAAATILTSKV